MSETQTQLLPLGISTLKSNAFELCLLGEEGEVRQSWSFKTRELMLGSHISADLQLDDPSVSRQHASIQVDETGHLISDLNSKNGLWVNGLRVREVYLNDGALIQLGRVQLRYQINQDQPIEHLLSLSSHFGQLIGHSTKMRAIFAQLEQIAQGDMTLLIEGESGTGKELAAEAVHQRSTRAQGPFIVFDCSAVSATLIESELFGHKQGAFTGATQNRDGAFRRAEGGTLFLDEIGELPLELQPRLLRALEKREVKAVGDDSYIPISVRVIAATNRNLATEVDDGQFRADLYYRLAVLKIILPPLRSHVEDIPLLVEHFLRELSPHTHKEVSYETMLKMQKLKWQGNVRELKNFITRALTFSSAKESQLNTQFLLPHALHPTSPSSDQLQPETLENWIHPNLPFKDAKARLIEHFERLYWKKLLERHSGNLSAAARDAGIHRKSAEYLLKKLDLKPYK